MNNIKINQNKPDNLMLLAAQRVAYERAKYLFGIQILLTVGVAVIFNLIRLLPKELIIYYMPYIITISVIISLIDILVFIKYISKIRTGAAQIQEQFDCSVYGLPWNKFICESKPDKNFIYDNYKRYIPNVKKPIENWYDIDLEGLSQTKAILLCQETNLWYDGKLREKFKNVTFYVLLAMIGISLIISLIAKADLGLIVLYLIAPLLPAIILITKIHQENDKSINASNELKRKVIAMKQPVNDPTMEQLRQIQDKIFCIRKDSSLIPEWFYIKKRPRLEKGMKVNASN